jgi:hypothetical protein
MRCSRPAKGATLFFLTATMAGSEGPAPTRTSCGSSARRVPRPWWSRWSTPDRYACATR